MAVEAREREPVTAAANEHADLVKIERLVEQSFRAQRSKPKLVGPDGEAVELPESVFRLLRQVVHDLSEGRMVTIVPQDQELTTQEAADLLNVSRPYLVKLLEQGNIPYAMTGTHRRVRFVDIMAYKQQRDAQRNQGLDRLARMSQEMGLYEG